MVSSLEFWCASKVFFFSFFFSSKSYHNLYDTCDLRITNIIYDSLNCAIFLNILFTILFYQFFYYVRIPKQTQCYIGSFLDNFSFHGCAKLISIVLWFITTFNLYSNMMNRALYIVGLFGPYLNNHDRLGCPNWLSNQ